MHYYKGLFALFLCACTGSARDPKSFRFYSWDRHRTYTFETQEVGTTLRMGGHWMYQPSLIFPAPETGNQWALVFNSNLTAGSNSDQAIFVGYSPDPASFQSRVAPALKMSESENICDMADARPVWDGSEWHVYVQALQRNSAGGCSGANVIVQAKGPVLTNLAWDVVPGTRRARVVVPGSGRSSGIGEDQHWFYTGKAPHPFVALYNDWGDSQLTLHSGYSTDGAASLSHWYSVAPAADWTNLPAQGYVGTPFLPDVLLSGSLDEAVYGPIGLGAQSSCWASGADANLYQYSRELGYYASLLGPKPLPGRAMGGALRSISSDAHGERMFHPRFARDSRGFLAQPEINGGTRRWTSIVIYNPAQVTNLPSDGCNTYSRWTSEDQQFAITWVTITEQ